jgi:TRAP-type C4-dicarboxylate transport system permease large subunit
MRHDRLIQLFTIAGNESISKASFPMFLVMCAFVVILVMVPERATWLPEALGK